MATHNSFTGYAQVMLPPRVIKTSEDEYVRATCSAMTIRGKRSIGDSLENIRYDTPAIRTSNQELCEEISRWKVGDMVEIKGTVTSREIIRTNTCPKCNGENQVQGIMTYVHPIFCDRRETNITHEEGINLLRYRCEISNNVTLIGMLTVDPQFHETQEGTLIGKYQIAVLRRFRIKEDSPDRKADFIWIKSFGKIAKKDQEYLKKGTFVFIDGVLQTVPYERKITCAHCGEEFTAKEMSMEVVPYQVEYLRGYIPQEEDAEIADDKNSVDHLVGESKIQQKANALLDSLK